MEYVLKRAWVLLARLVEQNKRIQDNSQNINTNKNKFFV
jgi:hypothetical protein